MTCRRIAASSTVASAVAFALAAAGSAHAAEQGPLVQTSLEDIVVTATKREEKLKDVAMGISAVSGDDLVRRNETSFVDFAAQVPGLSLQVANPGQIRLVLRGANIGSVGATVATVIDDIPFSMTGAQTNGAFFGANVDTYDLQRVEVLRGPQGTLYGATAEGGLIKYVTNAPNLDRFEGDFGAGFETVKGGSSTPRVRGMINLPLVDGKLAFRMSAVKEDRAGWIDNPARGEKDWNDIEKYSVRASLLWKPNDRLSARLTYFRQNQISYGNNNIDVVGATLTPANPPANQFDPVAGQTTNIASPLEFDSNLEAVALNVQFDFDSFSLMSSTSYAENTQDYLRDFTYGAIAPGVTIGDVVSGLWGEPALVQIPQIDLLGKLSQELRISSKPGSTLAGHGFDWQAGLFFTHEIGTLFQPVDAIAVSDGRLLDLEPPPGFPILFPPGGADIPSGLIEKSAFADFTYHFTDQFDLEFGARHSKTKQFSQVKLSCCLFFGPDATFDKIRSSQNKTTYSLAPRFKFADGSMVYARFATGYRAGGPNLPTAQLPNPPLLKPDSTKNYEIGFRTDLLDNTLSIDVTAFFIDWKDAQVLSLVSTPNGDIGINGNAGTAESKGLEWNIGFRPTPAFSLGLVGAYTDAKVTTDSPGLGALKGQELPYVPDLQTTLNADWAFGQFAGFTATASASYTYVGKQFTDFSSSPVSVSHVELPDYQTLKLQLGIDNGQFNAQVYLNNLTNEDALIGYSSNGGAALTGVGTIIQPRTVGVFASYKF